VRRHRSSCAVAISLALLASSVLTIAGPATAGASTPRQKLSNEACDGFADYFTIEFLVAFASAFAGLGGESAKADDGSTVTADDVANTFHLIFSPKLEKITGTLAAESPKSIRKLFARQHAVFAQGVDMLEELGLTKRQLKVLSELDLSPNTDVAQLLGEVKVSKAKLLTAAKDFGKIAAPLDLNDSTTAAQQRAFQQTGTRCGVFPESDLDCESLVGTELSAPLVGGDPAVKNDQGSCTYTGPAGADGDEPVMIVDVYPSPRTFDRLIKALPDAEKVGDAYVADGFSSFSSTKTCGKTLYSQNDGDTIVVALCPPGDGDVNADDLLQVRDAVVAARSILNKRSG
jgi:hypothetical protein